MNYKRVLTIQDISCVGQCSMTVALPILSACGQETCILPSAVLSTHTGGFTGFTVRDLTDDFPGIQKHWQAEKISFDAIYTGYLGSVKQIGYVADIFNSMLRDGGKIIVDPAMADNGKLYYGFDEKYVAAMRTLCAKADVVLPNITESSLLTGTDYREKYDEAYVNDQVDRLFALGAQNVIITGVSYSENRTGVYVCEKDCRRYYEHEKISRSYHGTGDIYSSAFTGCLVGGKDLFEAAAIAADYTVKCIANTISDDEHWYGVKFESAIPYLVERLS